MIKILHIIYSFNIGGMENGLVNIINQSDPNFFAHEVCCLTTSGDSVKKLHRPVPVYELHQQSGNSILFIPTLVQLIKRVRPDIVHTRNWGGFDGVIAAILAGVPVIHGEHGWNIDDPTGNNWKRKLIRKAASPFISQFVAVSADIQRWLVEFIGIPAAKVTTIINGVDTGKYQIRDEADLRGDCQAKDEIVIGSVGRLFLIKRFDRLINAFCQIDHTKYNVRLIIIGNGPEYGRLKTLIEQSPYADKIQLLGERLDIHLLYSLMDVFALVSINEGISNTIIEAMSCGLPVIATNVGGNKELVRSGQTGWLIGENPLELTRSIEHYLANPRLCKLHGEKGRETVLQHYSLERMINSYQALYRSIYRKQNKRLG